MLNHNTTQGSCSTEGDQTRRPYYVGLRHSNAHLQLVQEGVHFNGLYVPFCLEKNLYTSGFPKQFCFSTTG